VNNEFILDASALLAVMLNEPGWEKVRAVLGRSYIHAVNVAEVIGQLVRKGVPVDEALQAIEELGLEINEELGVAQAASAGDMVAATRQYGLSLGDCICLAMATWFGSVAVTADRQWQKLHGTDHHGGKIQVLVIR
jgi:ribonuclease VapC